MSPPFDKMPDYKRTGRIPPEHDVRLLPKFETVEEGKQRRNRLARLATRRSGGTITPRFATCTKDARCDSGACPICMRRFRRWFGHAVMNLIGRKAAVFVTVVDERRHCPPGELGALSLEDLLDECTALMSIAGLGNLVMVGGIDFSFNTDGAGRWPDHWCPHFAVLVIGATPNTVKAALSKRFRASSVVRRPVNAKAVTDPLGGITYLIKSVYSRRSSYFDKKKKRYDARDLPLKAPQEHELTLFLDQFQPVDRLFLQNIRIKGAKLVKEIK